MSFDSPLIRAMDGKQLMHEEIVLTLYFCGTDGTMSQTRTQLELFGGTLTSGIDISSNYENLMELEDEPYYVLSVEGVGVEFGIMGTIFGSGLEDQVSRVINVITLLRNHTKPLIVNCVGLSRGAIAILLLIQETASYDPSFFTINCVLFDPVPGNLISITKFDFLSISLAKKSMNISRSKNLRRVLALYPVEPLLDLEFHAPLLPVYPEYGKCVVTEMVLLGCHQGGLTIPFTRTVGDKIIWSYVENSLSFPLIRDFLLECKTRLKMELITMYEYPTATLVEAMDRQLAISSNFSIRHCHNAFFLSGLITRHEKGEFLNQHHELLKTGRIDQFRPYKYMLSLERNSVFPLGVIVISILLLAVVSAIALPTAFL